MTTQDLLSIRLYLTKLSLLIGEGRQKEDILKLLTKIDEELLHE